MRSISGILGAISIVAAALLAPELIAWILGIGDSGDHWRSGLHPMLLVIIVLATGVGSVVFYRRSSKSGD